jgi:hypothetical protein
MYRHVLLKIDYAGEYCPAESHHEVSGLNIQIA